MTTMLSQPQFDRACKLLQECLKELPGWLEVSFADRDGGYTREFFLWSHVDERLGRPALAAAIYVNRKTLIIQRWLDQEPVTREEMHEWLRQQFPMLNLAPQIAQAPEAY
jgi:hypothetical protein